MLLLAGTVNGAVIAGLFNPWDRALYLSVTARRPFFHVLNWKHPYQAFGSAMMQRTIAQGLWFPLNDALLELVLGNQTTPATAMQSFIAGNAAGAINGLLLNPLSAVKYQCWGSGEPLPVLLVAKRMFADSGRSLLPFVRGTCATVVRDVVFGGSFALVKFGLTELQAGVDDEHRARPLMSSMSASLIAGGCATVLSGPFNYARNMQYATPSSVRRAPSSLSLLRDLFARARLEPFPLVFLQTQLRLGWGTARVAVGMMVGWEVYGRTKHWLDRLVNGASARED